MTRPRQKYPSDMQSQFMLRFPDGYRDRIKERAKVNGRSMNAEIIALLAAAMGDAAIESDRLTRIEARLDRLETRKDDD